MEEEIQILNFNNIFREQYRINKKREIQEENLEKFVENQNSDKIIIKAKIIDKFIVIITVKVKNQLDLRNKNMKEIQLNSFNINIIKYNQKNNQNQQININIPIKGEVNIPPKDFFNQKFYFFDLALIDDIKSFFFLYIFNQMHFFKLYQKDEQLKYNKIKIKNFNNETDVLYLGKNLVKEKNILEIELLLKPDNSFYYIPIDITNENKKFEEKEFLLEKKENKNILNKFLRSNCEFFLFLEKKENKKYILSTDEKTKEIIFKELNINNLEQNSKSDFKILYLFKILEKIYIIADTTKKEDELKYFTFEIYNILPNEKDNNYDMKLLQQIKILNNEGIKEYDFNINTNNYLSINLGKNLFFIHLDEKGIIDMINLIQIDSKKLNIRKYYYDKSQDLSLLIFFINGEIYFSKFIDEFEKEEKYLSKENKNEKLEEKNNNNNNSQQKENESTIEQESINQEYLKKNGEFQNITNEKIFIENESNNLTNDIIKAKIEKIIIERIEKHKYKIKKLIEEKKRKLKDINSVNKNFKEENKYLKDKYDNIFKVIINLQKMKTENNNYYEEEEIEEYENQNKINYNPNNNYNNIYPMNMNHSYNNNQIIHQMYNPHNQNMNHNFHNYSFNQNQINPQYMNYYYPNRNMMINKINNNNH